MITSINLNSIPFLSSTDATRASMISKQVQQALTSPTTEIPYVIGSDYKFVRDCSNLGINIAKDDGSVMYKNSNNDLIVVRYDNLETLEEIYTPAIKRVYSIYGTTLRSSLNEGDKFKKGDIIASYDCFKDGVPSYGYNTFTGFMLLFGFNHEDSIVCSESFAEKAKVEFIDKVYIPIYEYTLMKSMYENVPGSFTYFPNIGQKIDGDSVCSLLVPKGSDGYIGNAQATKTKVQQALKTMSISHLLTLDNLEGTKFAANKIKSKVENGKVSGIRIHRLKPDKEINLIDTNLHKIIKGLYRQYANFIVDTYDDLNRKLQSDYAKYLFAKYYNFTQKKGERGNIKFDDACYLMEIEITKKDRTWYGDKLANRYANKGVVSLILPDELRPVAVESNIPLDLIFNPFAVFSRMNLGQILEGIVGKSVMYCDNKIRTQPEKTAETIKWLNESVIKHIDSDYYNRIDKEIITNLENNNEFKQKFINKVTETNLFVEAPCFAEINIKDLLKTAKPYRESVLLKKELIKYMKQKLKVDVQLPNEDVTLKNIFCAPMYIQKLYKMTKKIMNARDLGSVKAITQQPLKGRARGGGSKIGQMELESMIANGTDLAIKEFLSVKSDWKEGKSDLIKQLVTTGEYHLPEDRTVKSRTREVVDVQLSFLKE